MAESSGWDRDALADGLADNARPLGEFVEFFRCVAEEVDRKPEVPRQVQRRGPIDWVLAAEAASDDDQIDIAIGALPSART